MHLKSLHFRFIHFISYPHQIIRLTNKKRVKFDKSTLLPPRSRLACCSRSSHQQPSAGRR